MIESLKKELEAHPDNPFLQGHVEALTAAEEKRNARRSAAACSLLPCPFCGTSPIYDDFSNHREPCITLRCSNPKCSVTFGPAYLDSDTTHERVERERMLAALWNRRVNREDHPPQVGCGES